MPVDTTPPATPSLRLDGPIAVITGADVVFLAPAAAALITGTSLLVDGGWTAQ